MDRSIRVLRGSPRLPPCMGGQEVHVAELTGALALRGLVQVVVFAEGEPLSGVASRRVSTTRRVGNIAHDTLFGLRLAGAAGGSRFDVVHTHGDGPVARGGALAARRCGAVHIHTVHGGLIRNASKRAILRAAFPHDSWYLALSSAVGTDLVELGVDPNRVRMRTSGVRRPFLEVPLGGARSGVAIGGRLVPNKGITAFVEAWINAGVVEPSLYVFGAGPEEDRVARAACGATAVHWLGRLTASELADLFGQTSVGLVLQRTLTPSTGGEGTPTVGLEMLASGCIPIVSGGVGELSGLMAAAGMDVDQRIALDPQRVADTAARLAGQKSMEQRKRARAILAAGYSWESVASDVLDWYRTALAERSR